MNPTLIKAIICITLALVFYTMGVWKEQREKKLKASHMLLFWLGFCFDSAGTGLMSRISGNSVGLLSNIHGITGIAAIVLMLIHAIWATAILVLRDKEGAETFHRYSMMVWRIWLVPFVLGVILGIAR